MRLLIGNFKGPEGKQGEKGNTGETGATGQRGSRWTSGTAVTGTSVVGTIFSGTGITDARLHDYYINPDTGNVYECTVEGTADVAEWTHIGNIKGPKGATGPAGSISDIEEQKPTYTEAAKLENISSGETIKVAFGKLKKAMAVLIAHYTQKATVSILGHVKFSDSAAITTAGEYALDAIEKNASVNGTLANLIAQINSNLVYKPGDTIVNISSFLWSFGTLTNSGTSVRTFIPINKPIVGAIDFELTGIEVRQNGEYLVALGDSESISDAGIQVEYTRLAPGIGVNLGIIKTGGWGGENNNIVNLSLRYKIDIV